MPKLPSNIFQKLESNEGLVIFLNTKALNYFVPVSTYYLLHEILPVSGSFGLDRFTEAFTYVHGEDENYVLLSQSVFEQSSLDEDSEIAEKIKKVGAHKVLTDIIKSWGTYKLN